MHILNALFIKRSGYVSRAFVLCGISKPIHVFCYGKMPVNGLQYIKIMQKRNYQKELDAIIAADEIAGIRPKLLMHSCCAPCSSYVMEYLRTHFRLTMFFYNPNMDSRAEYDKRSAELQRLIGELNEEDPLHLIECVTEGYDPESFEAIAAGHESDPERGARCLSCYALRLRRTAEYMESYNKEHPEQPFDYYATTLTLSPLKSAEALNDIAEQIAAQKQLRALPTDFKKKNGYKRSIELSHLYGLYRQNYCGCRFSKRDAEERETCRKSQDIGMSDMTAET